MMKKTTAAYKNACYNNVSSSNSENKSRMINITSKPVQMSQSKSHVLTDHPNHFSSSKGNATTRNRKEHIYMYIYILMRAVKVNAQAYSSTIPNTERLSPKSSLPPC
eukprot:UN01809